MKKRLNTLLVLLFTLFAINAAQAMEAGPVDIHGFISQGFMKSDDNNYLALDSEEGTFQFNDFGINFSSELTDKLHLGVQFLARDLGDLGNDDIELDWAYADYRWKDWAGLRAGKIKIPAGLYNETRDVDALRTFVLLPQSVYREDLRETLIAMQGLGVYGNQPLNKLGDLSYQVQWGTFNMDKDGGVAKATQSTTGGLYTVSEFRPDDVYTAAVQWSTPLEGLRVGATGMKLAIEADILNTAALGAIPAGTTFLYNLNNIELTVYSAEYTLGNLVLAAEYTNTLLETQIVNVTAMSETTSEGYYLSGTYRFTDRFELGAYYSEYYRDKDDKDGASFIAQGQPDHRAWQKDLAVTTKFDLNEYWVFKLEGHLMDGTAQLLASENPAGYDKDWFMFMGKISFSF